MSTEKLFDQLKGLPQYKNLSKDKLIEVVKEKIRQKNRVKDFDLNALFSDVEERKLAKGLLRKYLEDFAAETISDENLLKQIIYFEITHWRLQEKANQFKDKNMVVPINLIRTLIDTSNQIILLKQSLGITSQQKEQSDSYKAIQLLMKKFKVWRDENVGSRQMICPHCGEMVLLKIRTDKYDVGKHPFFKDKILYNEHLFKCYKEGKITKTDVARILEVSEDYIDWILSKVNLVSITQ